MARRLLFPFIRILALLIIRTSYRFQVRGQTRVPEQGAVLLIANHVSYIDSLFIAASVRRPIRFVMNARIFATPFARRFFTLMGAIPIASHKENPELLECAFEEIASALESGEAVCIFPEGQLTHDGQVNLFRSGIERIVERTPTPVLPMALRGLWGSVFSRKDGAALRRLPSVKRSATEVVIGAMVSAPDVDAHALRAQVCGLRGSMA